MFKFFVLKAFVVTALVCVIAAAESGPKVATGAAASSSDTSLSREGRDARCVGCYEDRDRYSRFLDFDWFRRGWNDDYYSNNNNNNYNNRNWYYQSPEPDDRYRTRYEDRYAGYAGYNDDRYTNRPTYSSSGYSGSGYSGSRYPATNDYYRGNGYDNKDPYYYDQFRDFGYSSYRDRTSSDRNYYDRDDRNPYRYNFDYRNYRPYDETYRGVSGFDNSGRGYYFANRPANLPPIPTQSTYTKPYQPQSSHAASSGYFSGSHLQSSHHEDYHEYPSYSSSSSTGDYHHNNHHHQPSSSQHHSYNPPPPSYPSHHQAPPSPLAPVQFHPDPISLPPGYHSGGSGGGQHYSGSSGGSLPTQSSYPGTQNTHQQAGSWGYINDDKDQGSISKYPQQGPASHGTTNNYQHRDKDASQGSSYSSSESQRPTTSYLHDRETNETASSASSQQPTAEALTGSTSSKQDESTKSV